MWQWTRCWNSVFPGARSIHDGDIGAGVVPSPGRDEGETFDQEGRRVAAVVTKNMIVEPWPPHAAFGNLKPADGDVSFGPVPAGDYVMSVELNGKEISAYSFGVKAEKGSDPFNPKTR